MITFRVERVPTGLDSEYTVPMLVHDSGVRRRASEEEAALWDALQAATSPPMRETPAEVMGPALESIRESAARAEAELAATGKAPDFTIPEGDEPKPRKKGR